MALSVDSKVKELMKNEAAAELIEKYAPGFKTNPQMKLVQALTFRKLPPGRYFQRKAGGDRRRAQSPRRIN